VRSRDLLNTKTSDFLALEKDSAGVNTMMTHDRVEQRGFAGAVWPNKANDFSFPEIEGYVIIRHDATKAL
jgi:hypothetical protein